MAKQIPKRAKLGQLAEIAGMSTQMMARHIKKAGVKRGKDYKYQTQAVLSAVLLHRRGDNKNSPAVEPTARKKDLECQKLELELAKMRGEIMPRAQHMEDMRLAGAILKAAGEKLVKRVAAKIRRRDATRIAEDIAREMCADAVALLEKG